MPDGEPSSLRCRGLAVRGVRATVAATTVTAGLTGPAPRPHGRSSALAAELEGVGVKKKTPNFNKLMALRISPPFKV